MASSKILIIVIHPNLKESVVNKRWMEALIKFPEKYVVHDLYAACPDQKIDVIKEQRLVEDFDRIIFQFPFYWFNCPPLLKQWLDEVLIQGWAFGSASEYQLAGKKIALAVSTGIDQKGYQSTGKYRYTMEQLLAPFELTFEYIKADYRPAYILNGLEFEATEERINQSVSKYLDYLEAF